MCLARRDELSCVGGRLRKPATMGKQTERQIPPTDVSFLIRQDQIDDETK